MEVEEKFKDLLDLIESPMSREQICTLLKNQLAFNEIITEIDSNVNEHRIFTVFKKISTPTLLRICKSLRAPELVCFEPTEDVSVSRYDLKSILTESAELDFNLNLLLEMTTTLAYEIILEIDLYIVNQLRKLSGTISFVDPDESNMNDKLFDLIAHMKEKSYETPTWMVVSSNLIEDLKDFGIFESSLHKHTLPLGVRTVGKIKNALGNFSIYEDTFINSNEILVGTLPDDKSHCYRFQPKTFLSPCTTVDTNTKIRSMRMSALFNCSLTNETGNLYGRLIVGNGLDYGD